MFRTLSVHSRESGSVLVVLTLSLTVLIGMSALAIDLGHAYLNKTRLQGAVDSVALSAAISVNNFNDPTLAEMDGMEPGESVVLRTYRALSRRRRSRLRSTTA